MASKYSELIIKAPFLFVKGFLMGYMHGRNEFFDYFFHRKSGIRRETLGEMVKEFLALDCYTDLCMPNRVVKDFVTAIEEIEPRMGITVERQREIESASFLFRFKLYDRKSAGIARELFGELPAGVNLTDYQPVEEVDEELRGVRGTGVVHPYKFQGDGKAGGDFEGVLNFFLTIKRSSLAELILCSDIKLHFKTDDLSDH